jgi:hypothetical protein
VPAIRVASSWEGAVTKTATNLVSVPSANGILRIVGEMNLKILAGVVCKLIPDRFDSNTAWNSHGVKKYETFPLLICITHPNAPLAIPPCHIFFISKPL